MDKKIILVVDDDPSSARYMSLALEGPSYAPRSAFGGVEALLAMERERPALLLADLHLPDLDGLELLTLVKERWPEIPVILVTVEQDTATIVEAVKRGATNYLVKPVAPSSLCSAVAKALATSAMVRSDPDRSVWEILGR